MNKKYYLVLLFVIASTSSQLAFSQKLPSTLLWRISGNGLQKPSYLYGTMHLTDQRIFNLGDSLYNAIEKSDGFAIEVDPEAFTYFIINEAEKRLYSDSVRLKEMMQPDKFQKYGRRLAEKLHINADEITTGDVRKEKDKWMQESLRTGKMKTFLDIYLFDIARRQGKWTGGVEDAKDQEGLDEVSESDIEQLALAGNESEMQNEIDETSNYMIRAYVKNDLNAIDSISALEDSAYEYAVLFKRNIKMAERMDSLCRKRTMVFAVGAAHLPGDKGLISLLKSKGFILTPVFSSKKIKPKEYKVAEVPLKWYSIKDEDSLYSVSMPGRAGDMTMYGIFHMKMYFDVFSSTLYMSAALKTPYSQSMADSVFGSLTLNYFGTSDFSKGKPIIIDQVPGREFLSKKEDYSHGYFLYKNGKMYMVVAMSMKEDPANISSISRFLHSFTIFEDKPGDHNNFVYSNKKEAYRIELPALPKSADDLVGTNKDTTTLQDIYVANDPKTGAYLFFGTHEAAPGYSIPNDSLILINIRESQKPKFIKMSIDTFYKLKEGGSLDIGGMMKQAPLMLKAHYQFRGNRWYTLVAVYDTARDNTAVQTFFNSFTTLDYTPVTWKNYFAPEHVFSAWAPRPFKYSMSPANDLEEPMYKYESYDSSRGDDFEVTIQKFGKYYWQESDSALWENLIKKYELKDSLLLRKPLTNGNLKGYELLLKSAGSSNIKRIRLFLNGDQLFTVLTMQSAGEINNENNNRFFDSFLINTPDTTKNLFVSKAALILNDIASTDSVVRNKAVNYLYVSPFAKDDLPLLHKALLKNYPGPKYNYFDAIKNQIKQITINLKDTSSFSFAKSNYATADDSTKNMLLTLMSSFPTKEHYNNIKLLLLTQPPAIQPGYDFVNELSDSTQLAAAILPDLLQLLKDTVMAPVIIKLSNIVIDSGLISKKLLLPYQETLLNIATKKLALLKADATDYSLYNYQLEKLLGKMNTAVSNSMLREWSLLPNSYLRWTAVNCLIHNNQAVASSVIDSVAKDLSTRVDLYDTLQAYKREYLFPAAYLSQQKLGESYVYESAEDDDPSAVTYLTQKVINLKGRPSRFYFYKLAFEYQGDTTYSLGCAGPFDMDLKKISSKETFGEMYYDEDYDPSQLQKQMDALIKEIENGFEWYEKKEVKK